MFSEVCLANQELSPGSQILFGSAYKKHFFLTILEGLSRAHPALSKLPTERIFCPVNPPKA